MSPETGPLASLYTLLYDQLTLKQVAILLGLGLIATHVAAYLKPEPVKAWLAKFPRNHQFGRIMLIVTAVWSFWLVSYMDLGEFYNLQRMGQILVPVGCFLVIQYVDDFLAVRSTGVLLMLMAGPVLNASVFQQPVSALLLPTLAYVWVFVGMFWVGMPYLARDWVNWLLTPGKRRFERGCIAGICYGALMFLFALFY